MKALVLGLALAVAFIAPVCAQNLDANTRTSPVTLRAAESHAVESADGTRYDVRVAFPDGYDASGDTRYPVLYVTDANFLFMTTVEAQRLLNVFGEVRPIILVGVDRPASVLEEMLAIRIADLTPSSMPRVDSVWTAQYGALVQSGGAQAFLTTLLDEVIPSVEARYPTSEERGLVGYSVGGVFVTQALFTMPDRFTHYMILSPSYWWGGGEMFVREEAYADAHEDLAAKVFLSAGSEEQGIAQGAARMDSVLNARAYRTLDLTHHEFQGETHVSVPPASISRGLRVLFGTANE
jgi:predicted alpha/beta superfamily hydrolase